MMLMTREPLHDLVVSDAVGALDCSASAQVNPLRKECGVLHADFRLPRSE